MMQPPPAISDTLIPMTLQMLPLVPQLCLLTLRIISGLKGATEKHICRELKIEPQNVLQLLFERLFKAGLYVAV